MKKSKKRKLRGAGKKAWRRRRRIRQSKDGKEE
jgi:hypothetical protein